jgi:DNA-binding MarR family transcriptional regulator
VAAYPGLAAPSSEYLRLVKDASLGMLALSDRLRQHWAAHAGAVGLTSAQAKLLISLVPGEAVPMRELAGRLDYDASNLTSLADRLQARGAVTRRPAAGDRRVKALSLTPDGERLRDRFWRQLVEDPGPLAPLDEAEIRALTKLLARLEPAPDEGPGPRR